MNKKNKYIFIVILFFNIINLQSQISCIPKIGDSFHPISVGVNFRENSNLKSKIIYKTADTEGEYFVCIEDGDTNDFVKLQIGFTPDFLEKNGLKKNFIKLYEHFRDSLNFDIKLKDFVVSIKNEEKIKEYYSTIINQNDISTLQYWSTNYDDEQIYDVSTIDSFKKDYLSLKLTPLSEKIIEIYNEIGYVNKSQLEKSFGYTFYFYNQDSSEFYLNQLNEYLKLKNGNYCEYDEKELFYNFSEYILSLVNEEKSFFGLKEINKYSKEFTSSKYKYIIDLLKMYCSYSDKNYSSAITIAKSLIALNKKNLLPESYKYDFRTCIVNGNIDISTVYNILIYSLIETESFSMAYQYSSECLKNKKIQYEGYLINHGIILLNQNKRIEACRIFNKEYLNGNEDAKKLIEDYCN